MTKIKIVLKQNGTEIIYQAGIANIFNDFFVSVGPKLASTLQELFIFLLTLIRLTSTTKVTLSTVQKIIEKLDNTKATELEMILV